MTKKGGVPLWTIAAAVGVVVLIAVVALVLRSLDQHASDEKVALCIPEK